MERENVLIGWMNIIKPLTEYLQYIHFGNETKEYTNINIIHHIIMLFCKKIFML